VEKRYVEPSRPVPDQLLIDHYLWLAGYANWKAASATPGVAVECNHPSEDERARARAALVYLYRVQQEEIEQGQRQVVDWRLKLFVEKEIRRCANETDPIAAQEELFASYGQRPRGRPPVPHRDFVIAGDVAKLVAIEGMTADAAIEEVASKVNLSVSNTHRIYYAADRAALKIDVIRRLYEAAAVLDQLGRRLQETLAGVKSGGY
jgi:hypothetical protein